MKHAELNFKNGVRLRVSKNEILLRKRHKPYFEDKILEVFLKKNIEKDPIKLNNMLK